MSATVMTVRFVEGRLRLATLAPVVFEALAAGEITLDIAKAYGATSDQEIQAHVFDQVSSAYYAPNPDRIRRMVLSGTVRGSDPRARLIGRDAYIAAGGRIDRELLDDEDSEAWADVALLEDLASARMVEHAKAMDSRERDLSNQQTFLVTITRLRDHLRLYVDNAAKLEAAVERNPGRSARRSRPSTCCEPPLQAVWRRVGRLSRNASLPRRSGRSPSRSRSGSS